MQIEQKDLVQPSLHTDSLNLWFLLLLYWGILDHLLNYHIVMPCLDTLSASWSLWNTEQLEPHDSRSPSPCRAGLGDGQGRGSGVLLGLGEQFIQVCLGPFIPLKNLTVLSKGIL